MYEATPPLQPLRPSPPPPHPHHKVGEYQGTIEDIVTATTHETAMTRRSIAETEDVARGFASSSSQGHVDYANNFVSRERFMVDTMKVSDNAVRNPVEEVSRPTSFMRGVLRDMQRKALEDEELERDLMSSHADTDKSETPQKAPKPLWQLKLHMQTEHLKVQAKYKGQKEDLAVTLDELMKEERAIIEGRDFDGKSDWVASARELRMKTQVAVGTATGKIDCLMKSFQAAVEGADQVDSIEAATTLLKAKGPDAVDMTSSIKAAHKVLKDLKLSLKEVDKQLEKHLAAAQQATTETKPMEQTVHALASCAKRCYTPHVCGCAFDLLYFMEGLHSVCIWSHHSRGNPRLIRTWLYSESLRDCVDLLVSVLKTDWRERLQHERRRDAFKAPWRALA